ncbi:MAG: kynureninase, partial [Gammaproteobacteria bacterium]|nr:kynureninase [Gammaproteobacteria bacterium]
MGEIDTEAHALALDQADPLREFRNEFHIPRHGDAEQAYFCGNSLGLQPKAVLGALMDELDDWANLGVEGHFLGKHPWMPYHEFVRESLAACVGAMPSEVVAMNSLSVNLHLMMVSFYRPTPQRHAILIEAGAFPSDRYAVESQVRFHGFDPATSLIELEADEPGGTISMQAIERVLAERGSEIALVLWPGVQYRSGQAFDLKEVTRLAQARGCVVGFDLAHGAGNRLLDLHDSGADFAAWCSYKYLNSGPGAVAGCFVHERHALSDRPRFAGWWGHDQATRFRMGPEFVPTPGADGWQL